MYIGVLAEYKIHEYMRLPFPHFPSLDIELPKGFLFVSTVQRRLKCFKCSDILLCCSDFYSPRKKLEKNDPMFVCFSETQNVDKS